MHSLTITPDRAEEVAAAVAFHYWKLRDRERSIMAALSGATSVLDLRPADIADADDLHGTLPLFRDLVECIDEVKDDPEEIATAINGYLQDKWERHIRTYKDNKESRRRDYAERVLFRIIADATRPKMPAGLVPKAA